MPAEAVGSETFSVPSLLQAPYISTRKQVLFQSGGKKMGEAALREKQKSQSNPLLKKIGVKDGMRVSLLKRPADTAGAFDALPDGYSPKLVGVFDYIHLFVNDKKEFLAIFPKAKKHLERTGMLWVSWPKRGGSGTDLTIKSVIQLGYDFGLVESKCISVDSIWSALKFTFPKTGKVYHNSYGRLP